MSRITFLLLNWQRPKNLPIIIEQLKRQTAPSKIFLWNNGSQNGLNVAGIDWRVDSSCNAVTMPRWHLAAMAQTDYVCSMDDDLCLLNNNTVGQLIDFMDRQDDFTAVGGFGVKLVRGKTYLECEHVAAGPRDIPVDIIKGRILCVRRTALSKVPLLVNCNEKLNIGRGDLNCFAEDDVAVSALLKKRTFGGANSIEYPHRVASLFNGRIAELPKGKFSLEGEALHYINRDIATKFFYG